MSSTVVTRIEQGDLDDLAEYQLGDITALRPADTWVNLLDLRAQADGQSDCTDILEQAITEHATIYLPMGTYLISRTLTLRKDTQLIGLYPFQTRIVLVDGTPGFSDPAKPASIFTTPPN